MSGFDLSIVIVSYNTRNLLRACLESLPAGCGELSYEVFVVDNCSADGSPEMVRDLFPSVHLIANQRNLGFAAANNQALVSCSGYCVLMLNSDTVVEPGALEQLVHFMVRHPKLGYCGPQLLNPDGTHQVSARRFPTPLSGFLGGCGWANKHTASRHCLNLHALFGTDRPFQADALSGACLMIRREVLQQVGLLDSGYFMYFEETQLCHRMLHAGFPGWYCPLGRVTHWGGQSVGVAAAGKPFGGDHPYYWLKSRRRYMRFAYGWSGMLTAELLDVVLHALVIFRNVWRRDQLRRIRARSSLNRLAWVLGTCFRKPHRPTSTKVTSTSASAGPKREWKHGYVRKWADST